MAPFCLDSFPTCQKTAKTLSCVECSTVRVEISYLLFIHTTWGILALIVDDMRSLLDSNMIAPPLSLTIQTDHKFKCYNIVGDKHTDLVDDRNVLHRNGRIIQNIVRLDFKFILLLCITNVN